MNHYRLVLILAGAATCVVLAFATLFAHGPEFVAELESRALAARDAADGSAVSVRFTDSQGWLTRHPVLSGGEKLDAETRTAVAVAIADTPGIGGVTWQSRQPRGRSAGAAVREVASHHCQDDVEAILRVRTIRFADTSARIDRASDRVLDEVAEALAPCVGGIIAITGHTDSYGDEIANLALSIARANAVRWALVGRGIPADGLRATGVGSAEPVEGLDPADAANRRIEFSVIETMPLTPTPVDVPGPG